MISPAESVWKAKLEQKFSHRDASQDTELVLSSSWHSTGSQVGVIGTPEKNDLVTLLDPFVCA